MSLIPGLSQSNSRLRSRAHGVQTCCAVMIALLAAPSLARADIEVRFTESAPKDRFTITNVADCALGASDITIDLAGSAAGLIFDTTGAGAGVEVFQPFELAAGGDYVTGTTATLDGDTEITLNLAELPPGAAVAFTIDVDDTAGSDLGQIRVSGGEIAGASVRSGADEGVFSDGAIARVAAPCPV